MNWVVKTCLPSTDRQVMTLLNGLAPKMKFVDDFSAIIALCFGADATLTAMVWGSIRLILTPASSAGDTLQDVLDMLEELSLTLPRFRVYEDTLPMNRQLESALADVYTEVICFYARTIHFFRVLPPEPIGFLGLLPILLGLWKFSNLFLPERGCVTDSGKTRHSTMMYTSGFCDLPAGSSGIRAHANGQTQCCCLVLRVVPPDRTVDDVELQSYDSKGCLAGCIPQILDRPARRGIIITR